MKGKISPNLESVLKDPQGRHQLMQFLEKRQDGKIVTGNKSYVLKIDVTKSQPK